MLNKLRKLARVTLRQRASISNPILASGLAYPLAL